MSLAHNMPILLLERSLVPATAESSVTVDPSKDFKINTHLSTEHLFHRDHTFPTIQKAFAARTSSSPFATIFRGSVVP